MDDRDQFPSCAETVARPQSPRDCKGAQAQTEARWKRKDEKREKKGSAIPLLGIKYVTSNNRSPLRTLPSVVEAGRQLEVASILDTHVPNAPEGDGWALGWMSDSRDRETDVKHARFIALPSIGTSAEP